MTLRIKCPACDRQFKVGEELKGRMVECGACEKQFQVDADSIVAERDRYFPGDIKKKGLDHYGQASQAARSARPQVQFATATYDQRAKAADVIPTSPQRMFAGTLGVVAILLFVLILLFGSQDNGIMSEMAKEKRILLSGFVALVGSALIFYGSYRRKVQAVLSIAALAGLVMSLAVFLPVADLAVAENPRPPAGDGSPVDGPEPETLSELEIQARIGYDPVQKAIATFGYESVVALWIPSLKASFKYQVQRYLHRKTGTGERPSIYNREPGGLIVIEGTRLTLAEVEKVVERFATVEEVYPNIRVLKLTILGDRLVPPSPDLESKLNDKDYPGFYRLNEEELDHIDIDRVREAAHRLAKAEPKTRRPQISARLVQLLEEDSDTTFRSTICDAIMVWSEPGDGAEEAVARLAQTMLVAGDPLPRSMMQFLIARRAPESLSILEALWVKDPSTWEPLVVDFGAEAEGMVLTFLKHEDRGVVRSAATVLKRIGTKNALPGLRAARGVLEGDEEMRVILDSTIQTLAGGPAPAPPPGPGPSPE